jgi:signal recognition particle subunit SEC65
MPDHFYVYPAYIRRSVTRAMGRRVPSSEALPEVGLESIAEAAKALGFHVETEANRQYPRDLLENAGRVKVRKKAGVTKTAFLKRLCAELHRRAPAPGKT